WKTAAATAVLAAVAGIGAVVAPPVRAQGSTPRPTRALEMLGGRGSQIGVSVRDGATPGVVVEDVSTDSPAEKAGIKKGDVITEFDGERVRSVRQFTRLVQETPPGRKVEAVLMRDSQRVNVSVEPRESDGLTVLRDFANGRVFGDLS